MRGGVGNTRVLKPHRPSRVRRCGGIFCAECSTNRRALPSFGFNEPVRVCDSCAMKEDALKAHLAPSRPTVSSAALAIDILASAQRAPASPQPRGSPHSSGAAARGKNASKSRRRKKGRHGDDDDGGVNKAVRAATVMEVRSHSGTP